MSLMEGQAVLPLWQWRMLAAGTQDEEHAVSQKLDTSPAVVSVEIGKNSFPSCDYHNVRWLDDANAGA